MKDKGKALQVIDYVRLNRQVTVLVIVVAVILGAGCGYLLGHWHSFVQQQRIAALEAQVEQLYQRAETFDYQQHIAQVELGIEKAATESLQSELLSVQDENFALRREIAFYQKIMAPELEAGGVSIDSLELQPHPRPGHFHFRLAIVQLERDRALTKGRVSMRLYGRVGEQGQHYDLYELANISAEDAAFSMRYFTVQAGDFILPDGFIPERIDVAIEVSGRKQESLARSFYWAQLVDNT